MGKYLKISLLGLFLAFWPIMAQAQQSGASQGVPIGIISQANEVCDPYFSSQCARYGINGEAVSGIGVANIAPGQVSVGTTPTLVAAARTGAPGTGRQSITIINGGTVDEFCGGSGVTTTTGVLLVGSKGASLNLNTQAAIYCVVATGTEPTSYIETY